MRKLLVRLLMVIPKKLFSFFIFPFIYSFRKKVYRSMTSFKGEWQLDRVKMNNKGLKLFVWFFLDDSIYSETYKEYNIAKNNLYKFGIHNDFLNAWYWNGVRNTSNNLSHYISKGRLIKVIKTYLGKHYLYEIRKFEKGIYPYLEVYILGLRFNVGWLKSGKFEGIKVRKRWTYNG